MAYTKYSLTPANNNAAPPDGAPEGMLPSAVNDTMRDMMAQIRDVGDGIRGGTYTMTAPVITGGSVTGSTINNSAIGGTTAAAGKFTTLEATGVTTVQAGTVSAPAITTTGDTNTGIFFPAADTIAFAEGGVESMRINSSGNVGIGTDSPDVFGRGETRTLGISSSGTTSIGINAATGNNPALYLGVNGTRTLQLIGSATEPIINSGSSLPLLFGTSFTERMRITSAGRVGVGTTSPAELLDSRGAAVFSGDNATGTNAFGTAQGILLSSTTGVARITAVSNGNNSVGLSLRSLSSGSAVEGIRIDSSGNVGIGTSSPFGKLDVVGTAYVSSAASNPQQIAFFANGTASYISSTYQGSGSYKPLAFEVNGSERMRIDSSGNLLVGTTNFAFSNTNNFMVEPSIGNIYVQHSTARPSGAAYAELTYNANIIGSITQNGTTAVSFNTTSDHRLKENVAPMTGALAKVQALKPVTYTWKAAPDEIGEGFIAHELAEVCPQAVTGEKDAVNEDGSIKPQSIDTSFLVATLTAAIQEQQDLIENLTTRLNALEGK